MPRTPLAIHDELLLSAPRDARHDSDICTFCTDWSLTPEGIPSGFDRLEESVKQAPYGDIAYADPGNQSDGIHRYPIDTEAHARRTAEFLSRQEIAARYPDDIAEMRRATRDALLSFGFKDADVIVADAASEGGTNHMETISNETHEALLEKALRDATEALSAKVAELETANSTLNGQVAELTVAKESAEAEVASLKEANETLNGDLDNAQVNLKAVQDEVAALKGDIAAKEEAARVAEIASERADQVRNLGLFTEEYLADKASAWASMDEAAWTERLEEWKAVKGSAPAASATTDTASALLGTRGAKPGEQATARRAVLGLQ